MCVYVCVKRVPGCFPIYSDIISDRKQAFVAEFWKTRDMTDKPMDGRADGRTDGRSYRDAWTHLKGESSNECAYH